MGWGNSRRRRGAAPRHYKLPPPGPGLLIRQASVASPAGPGADTPTPVGGDVALTRADRQRHKIPLYNLTTGQPLPDVKGGNLAVNFDNSVFHPLFPEAELAIVRIPRPLISGNAFGGKSPSILWETTSCCQQSGYRVGPGTLA